MDTNSLDPKDNVIAIRVFDIGGNGGFTTHAFWGNPIIWGDWKYHKGTAINADNFKVPRIVNISPFSSPGVLFNGNIAPITKLKVKGIFWYQEKAMLIGLMNINLFSSNDCRLESTFGRC